MREFLSGARIVSFVVLLITVILNAIFEMQLPTWLGIIYPIVLVFSWLEYSGWNKKYHHKNDDFIGYIIMTDIVGVFHRNLDTLRATRPFGIWHYNRKKYRKIRGKQSLKYTLIAWFLKGAVFCIVIMILYVVVTLVFG